MDAFIIIISIFSAFVLGAAGSYIMETKGRSTGAGFALGFFLGALGVLIVLGLENRSRRTSDQTDRSPQLPRPHMTDMPRLDPAVIKSLHNGI